MHRTSRRVGLRALAVGLLLFGVLGGGRVQTQAPVPAERPSDTPEVYRTTGARVAIGRSIQVDRDEEVTDAVVVIGGSLRVEGRVRDGVVVIGGDVDLGPRADVRGDVVLVGGRLSRAPGAQLRGRVSDVSFGEWGSWAIGGWSFPTVSFGGFGRWLGLFGAIFRVSLMAVLMAMILLVARAPVARVGRAAGAEPVRAFLIGLVAEVLFLPALIVLSIGLVVTIIGIPLVALLVPIACLAAFIALMLGFTGIACRVGEWIEDRFGWRGDSAFLATTIGLVLIVAPTMISRVIGFGPAPIGAAAFGLLLTGALIEFVIWTTGLGAALMTGFGRWSTQPPPVPPVPHAGVVTVAS